MSLLIGRYGIKKLIYYSVYFTIYGLVKYMPPPIGDFFRYIILSFFLKKIGFWTSIKDGVIIYFPERVEIGKNVTINEYVYINGYGNIKIKDNVRIGHRTSIISEDHNFSSKDIPIFKQEKIGKSVLIEDDVWIGCDVKILKGVTIGHGVVIGAGSVITKDIPSYSVVVGNPGKIIKSR